jgi:hypothetical protein
MAIATLPAHGYQLIRINDDFGELVIERRLSKPEVVLGFAVIEREGERYPYVYPITVAGGVCDGIGETYALVRPDGKVDLMEGPESFDETTFASIDELKDHLRRHAAEAFREGADDAAQEGDRKTAASFRRTASLLAKGETE